MIQLCVFGGTVTIILPVQQCVNPFINRNSIFCSGGGGGIGGGFRRLYLFGVEALEDGREERDLGKCAGKEGL